MSSRDAYVAISDPTRRAILGLLRDRGALAAGEIASHFRSTSRPGISRHLRVLRECGVVRARRDGTSRRYTLESAPLRRIRDGWLATFSRMQMESLEALRRQVESDPHRR